MIGGTDRNTDTQRQKHSDKDTDTKTDTQTHRHEVEINTESQMHIDRNTKRVRNMFFMMLSDRRSHEYLTNII